MYIKPKKVRKNVYDVDEFRGRRTNLKVLPQTGKLKSIIRDKGRVARLPGQRISKTGKVYWETRKNRSDAPGKKI